jgi:hypothetical protein
MRISTNRLLVLAASATLALALASDPTPSMSSSFNQAEWENGRATIVCQVVSAQERANGTTLTVIDSAQAQAKAFMPLSMGKPPSVGRIVSLTISPSDRADFFFVEGISYL